MRDKKSQIFTRIERFQAVTQVWIQRWIGNDAQTLMLYRRGALLFFLGQLSNLKVTQAD